MKLTVKKYGMVVRIHDVESVRILQDTGYLPLDRDAEDLYAELATPATTPATPSDASRHKTTEGA